MRRSRRADAAHLTTAARPVTPALLRRMPLPQPDADDDKNARGQILAIGGSAQVPGAILLAGVAALRAGAGKLQLASCRSVAPALGVAVPEAMVVALPSHAPERSPAVGCPVRSVSWRPRRTPC